MTRKRRKRTNKHVPAKGRLRDMADRLWSLAVREDWGHRCAICGKLGTDAHHLVPRQHEATRYELKNGMALCPQCHKFDPNVSPHLNAAGFIAWLEFEHPAISDWYFEHRRPKFSGMKNAQHYQAVIESLRPYVEPEAFEKIVGQKFNAYLQDSVDNVSNPN